MLPAGFVRRALAWCVDATFILPIVLLFVIARTDLRALLSALQALQLQVDVRMVMSATDGLDFMPAFISLLNDASVQTSARLFATGLLHALIQFTCVFAVCSGVWQVFWETRKQGASPGKRMLGLQVVTADTQHTLNFRQAIGRHLAGAVSWITLNFGHLMAALPPEHTALHDRLSHTRVLIRVAPSRN